MAIKKKAKRGKKKAKGGLFNKTSEESVNPTKKFIQDASDDSNIELTETGKSHFETLKKQKYIDSMEPPILLENLIHKIDFIKPSRDSSLELDRFETIFEGVKYFFQDDDKTWLFLSDKAILLDFALMTELTIEYQEENILKYQPKLYNNELFFVTDKGITIYNLEEESWKNISISGEITSSVFKDHENFFIIVDFVKIVSLNDAFKENWSFITEGYLINTPILDDEYIYFTSSDGMLYKLDKTGDIDWSFNTKSALETSLIIFNDLIILNAMSGKLFFLSKAEKKEISSLDLGFHLLNKPFVKNEILYVFNRRFLYKISLDNFNIIEVVQFDKPIESASSLNDYIHITLSDSTTIIADSSFTNMSSTMFKSTKNPIQHANFLLSIDNDYNLLKTELV